MTQPEGSCFVAIVTLPSFALGMIILVCQSSTDVNFLGWTKLGFETNSAPEAQKSLAQTGRSGARRGNISPGGATLTQNVSWIELHPMLSQQRDEFFLEGLLAMMFLLSIDVPDYHGDIG
jgi:hypothetical protein